MIFTEWDFGKSCVLTVILHHNFSLMHYCTRYTANINSRFESFLPHCFLTSFKKENDSPRIEAALRIIYLIIWIDARNFRGILEFCWVTCKSKDYVNYVTRHAIGRLSSPIKINLIEQVCSFSIIATKESKHKRAISSTTTMKANPVAFYGVAIVSPLPFRIIFS